MCDLQNNVLYSWQLLSQFVSWEFCRCMCEDENHTTETDVLTFLRNMIVQRTEKSVSDITKHEIVAKFIMESKSIQNVSRMPCIVTLSESVKKICPELQSAVDKLVNYLEVFLNALEATQDSRKEIVQERISDVINDFSKEAKKLLPQPDLLKVVESWKRHHNHIPQKPAKKVTYSAALFEKVLECLHYESITSSEAKLIAVALHEDKAFQAILLSAEAEQNETEADSEQFSLSLQSSQPNEHIFSQEFGKNVGVQLNFTTANANCSTPRVSASQTPHEFPEVPDEIHDEPLQLSPDDAPAVPSPVQISPIIHTNIIHKDYSELDRGSALQNNMTDNNMQFDLSTVNESPPSEINSVELHDRIRKKFEMFNYQRTQNQSDSDTSDCDKNPQFKFLTPTLYKTDTQKNAPPKSQIVWLSDNESNDSSVMTNVANSQQNDPNWYGRIRSKVPITEVSTNRKGVGRRLRTQTQAMCSSDSDSNDAITKSPTGKDTAYSNKKKSVCIPTTKKKPLMKKAVRQLETSESSESIHSSLIENEGNLLHRLQQLPPSSVPADSELERPTKKRRMGKTVKLYSPNRSLLDFAVQIRKPVPAVTNEVPVHRGTNTTSSKRKRPQQSANKSSSKTQKCKHCNSKFKTAVALRRHVFLKHTQPPDDSDCD